MANAQDEIREVVDRETRAWDTKDIDLLLSIFHPDMVWPWPKTNEDHDPMHWQLVLGKFNFARWKALYSDFFNRNTLIHNRREIKRIEVSKEGDGALAVVDIDTLWVDEEGNHNHWVGRVCKVYAKTEDGWKITMHTGVLKY